MIERIESLIMKEEPDCVIVYGDTNSTLSGALAIDKLGIPVLHVEAGLRSFNKIMPEEINRVLVDHISAILFCPIKTAVENLGREGFRNILNDGNLIPNSFQTKVNVSISNPCVVNVGDVMFDIIRIIEPITDYSILYKLNLKPREYAVMTIHRAENTVSLERLKTLIDFVEYIDVKEIIFPVHPRTKKLLKKNKDSRKSKKYRTTWIYRYGKACKRKYVGNNRFWWSSKRSFLD